MYVTYESNWPTMRQMEQADGARVYPGRGDGPGNSASSFFDCSPIDADIDPLRWKDCIRN